MKANKRRREGKWSVGLVTLLIAMALLPRISFSKVYLTREEALKKVFPQAGKTSKKIVRLNKEQKKRIAQKTGYPISFNYKAVYIVENRGKRLGYGIVDHVKGKERFIKYLVGLDSEGRIKGIEVLTYDETHGSEIRHDYFKKQFIGKGWQDPLRLGVDIDAITGATISCRSITDGVRKIMSFWQECFGSVKKAIQP
jgi:Na+-translocating ferredoxin:NAD+ oxidoreductase RnfG subunit